MCGLVAYMSKSSGAMLGKDALQRALRSIAHRGPDALTTHIAGGIALGHVRLSIIDLAGGSQPQFNEDNSVACILNGEIYNHNDLRLRLSREGHSFRTRSDTEALVHLYEQDGQDAVHSTVGMFAYVIADYRKGEMFVYRDRLGEKPLYYTETPDYFVCASEIKALAEIPGVNFSIDRVALASYLRYGWIPAPLTIYQGVKKLEPGSYLHVTPHSTKHRRYWRATSEAQGQTIGRQDFLEEMNGLLSRTVPEKLIGEVPTGVLLSGGLDSSAIVAYAQAASTSKLRTFSVGFGSAINELPLARLVADRYKTDHTEISVGLDLVPDLTRVSSHFDEPFSDSSALPMLAVARAASKHVKVVLAGDGGDELFAGYSAYMGQRRYTDHAILRKLLSAYDRPLDNLGVRKFDPVPSLYAHLGGPGSRAAWMRMRTEFTPAIACQLAGADPKDLADPSTQTGWGADPLSQAFEFDINYYLPDDLLKKVDMMTMLCSIEARAPLLDHRIVELALKASPIDKLRGRQTKSQFREILRPLLPKEIVNGQKQGFGAPVSSWLRGPLREFSNDVLGQSAKVWSLLDRDLLEGYVKRGWADLATDWRAPGLIWSPMMLELWAQSHNPSVAGRKVGS